MTTSNSATPSGHAHWSGRMAFILAATGSAVGLGNIWKFPYITGEYGGGAFVLVYLLCIVIIGVPIMMSEVMIGRRAQRNPAHAMQHLALESGSSRHWRLVGWSGMLAGFIILSFYSVIAGWALSYVMHAISGDFVGIDADRVGAMFGNLLSSPITLVFWHTLFMAMTVWVVARGVRAGLERAVTILMPTLFVLLILLLGYAANTGEMGRAITFMFAPDFSKLSTEAVLTAMGHAFFTLSLGMGAIMAYGSYLPGHISITKAALSVAVMDTLVALLAGLAIFPVVFANQLEPGAGPGLIFQTLPLAFGQMAGGVLFGTLFFVLLTFAAWTSSISLVEPTVEWLQDRYRWGRAKAAMIVGGLAWVLGLVTVLSFNLWSKVFPLGMFERFAEKTWFDLMDFLTTNIMLPVGGLFIALFAGWVLKQRVSQEELELGDSTAYQVWRWSVRIIAPVAVAVVFVYNL